MHNDLTRRRAVWGLASILVTLLSASSAWAALAVPEYSSLPGAHAKVYLDFGGTTIASWGSYSPGTIPAYDTNGTTASFSATELANIRQIYVRVAEKFSPFNVNVTTVDPGNLNNKETARIIVGGNSNWYGSAVGGVAYRGGFTSGSSNIGWAFPAHLSGGNPKTVAECIAHEAGHLMWLNHQSSWSQDAAGAWVKNEYSTNNNDPARRPVMQVELRTGR